MTTIKKHSIERFFSEYVFLPGVRYDRDCLGRGFHREAFSDDIYVSATFILEPGEKVVFEIPEFTDVTRTDVLTQIEYIVERYDSLHNKLVLQKK